MAAYKLATKIDESGEIHLSELPFQAGEEVEVIILSREPVSATSQAAVSETLREQLPPVTQRLVGIGRGVSEEDYKRYLEEKYR